jgi:hypothetical protein
MTEKFNEQLIQHDKNLFATFRSLAKRLDRIEERISELSGQNTTGPVFLQMK